MDPIASWAGGSMIILGRLVLRRLDGWRRDAKCAKCCRVNSKIWPPGSRANCRSTVILYQTKTIEVYSWHLLATVRCGISQNMSEEDIRRLHRLDPGNPKVRSPFAILQVAQKRNWFISWLDVTVQNGAVCTHGWSIKLQRNIFNFPRNMLVVNFLQAGPVLPNAVWWSTDAPLQISIWALVKWVCSTIRVILSSDATAAYTSAVDCCKLRKNIQDRKT